MTSAGLIAATAGAVLVVALLLTWWGYPPVLVDPPSDLPGELDFISEGVREQAEFDEGPGIDRFTPDAFEFFDVRDIVWLVTGIAGFALGLSGLAGWRVSALLAPVTAVLALASIVLIALVLISPPDYVDVGNDFYGDQALDVDYDVPFGREIGGWVALAAALGVGAGALLVLREERR